MTSVHQLRSFGIAAVAYHCQWVADDDDDDEQEDDDYGDEYDEYEVDENDDNYYDDDQLQSFGVAGVLYHCHCQHNMNEWTRAKW